MPSLQLPQGSWRGNLPGLWLQGCGPLQDRADSRRAEGAGAQKEGRGRSHRAAGVLRRAARLRSGAWLQSWLGGEQVQDQVRSLAQWNERRRARGRGVTQDEGLDQVAADRLGQVETQSE